MKNLTGPLPIEITALALSTLFLEETQVCAPDNDLFNEWLDRIERVRIDHRCGP